MDRKAQLYVANTFLEVHVENKLSLNGTGIHFHGLHQKGTFQDDGVPAITQCPLAVSKRSQLLR